MSLQMSPRLKTAIGACSVAFLLEGCSPPYLRTTQEAYRVDPVMVQNKRRIENDLDCRNMREAGPISSRARDADRTDILCPLDLDTFKFPGETLNRLAYQRVAACQEKASAVQYLSVRQKALQIAQGDARLSENSAVRAQQQLTRAIDERKLAQKAVETATRALEKAASDKKSPLTEEKRVEMQKKISELEKQLADAGSKVEKAEAKVTALQDDRTRATTSLNTAGTDLENARTQLVNSAADDPETCRVLRNMLQDEIVMRSQQMCKRHLADMSATAAILNTDLGVANIVFSTLGAVVGGIQAKTNLAGMAGASSATQTLLNKEIYRDFVVPALGRAINSDRDRKHQEILADQSKDLVNYSLTKSLVDAGDFHERCSFAHGLLLLTTDADKRTPPRLEELEAQITANYAQIDKAESSLRYEDTFKDGVMIKARSSLREKEIVARTVERLRQENDTISVRINLMKRAQNPN